MSLLDSLLSGLAGTSAGPNSPVANPLVNIAIQMLTNRGTSGGLSSLIEQFQRAGLGPQMDSWISTGQNLPISPDQLLQVFGRGQMQQMSAESGLDVDQLSGGLAGVLPQLIDRLTPAGAVPASGVDDALAELSQLMPR